MTPADAEAYREIRLQALRDEPEAFASTFALESPKPIGWFATRLAQSHNFGAFRGPNLLGIATFFAQQAAKQTHKGSLVGMYVRPVARRAGIGQRLIEALIVVARTKVELLQLAVVVGNEPARRLYAKLGFVEYGRERQALKHGGRYYDELLMQKDFGPTTG